MDLGTSHRHRSPAHKCTASDNDEDVPDREHRYHESDIQQVASDLRRDGKQSWSENPRLYIILRDIAELIENEQPQVIDELINDGINDTWLPIFSKSILKKILPLYPQLHLPFLQAQKSVCTEPSRFRLAYGCPHGHLTRGSPPFRSIREVGAGRASVVDEVESLTDGKLYARKTVSRASNLRLARDDIRRFRCEIQTLIRINHWHCVKIIGSYTAPYDLSIIMSPVADSNLAEFLEVAQSSLKSDFVLRLRGWFGCLATAIKYLHVNQIRHRDIKPANILVHGQRILLVDFELAHDWKDLAQSTTTYDCGKTPLYAAPETTSDEKRNSATDIWSLGCVFLEMCTVVKGKRLSQLQDHFMTQTESTCFYKNPQGVTVWISLLEKLSSKDNLPFVWISKMLQHDKMLRPRAVALLDMIRDTAHGLSQPNPYFGECCQTTISLKVSFDISNRNGHCQDKSTVERGEAPAVLRPPACSSCNTLIPKNSCDVGALCFTCTNIFQTRIYRNPALVYGNLPVQYLLSMFHPAFMVQHLTRRSLDEFTQSIVSGDLWDFEEVNVGLCCLPRVPGEALHFKVRRYIPSRHLFALQEHSNSENVDIRDTLPVGIYQPDVNTIVEILKTYLDGLVDSHLIRCADLLRKIHKCDRSIRAIKELFFWFEAWKQQIPHHELLLLRSAVKLLLINAILAKSLTLAEVPDLLKYDYFHGYSGPQAYSVHNQSPRLLNRQVKVAFFELQRLLLEQVLKGFGHLLITKGSWPSCLFLSMCLAFMLERIDGASRGFLYRSRQTDENERGRISDIEEYRHGVEAIVFDRMYRLLSTKARGRTSRSSTMGTELADALVKLRRQFDFEERQDRYLERARDPSSLISAILGTVEQV